MPLIRVGRQYPILDDVEEQPNRYPLTEQGIDDLVADELPTVEIDLTDAPDGRYGIDKIHAWFHLNGLDTNADATKEDLLAAIKQLQAEQEST